MNNRQKLSFICAGFLVCASIMISLPHNVYDVKAKEKSINLVGCFYETKKSNDTVWGDENTYRGQTDEYKTLGKMNISGLLESAEVVDDAFSFIVDGNSFDINYPISRDRLTVTDDTKWHVSLSNGYAITIMTSFNNEDYTSELFIGEDNFDKLQEGPIYQGKDIQLINGCYYLVVVDYLMEKNVGKNIIGQSKYDYRTEEEEYIFYVENKDKEKAATSETKPRHNLGELRNTGHDNGYSGNKTLDKKDPHYGWDMGTFFINGYSGKNETTDGTPIFLKNVGDKITLWFNLEQSFDTSDPEGQIPISSKEKLFLSRDINGQDCAFGTTPTDLGYGALMIQYTDEDKDPHTPVVYTDFLYASTRTGADKRVFLFEEGDYEVHLNYELFRYSTPVTKEYNDYQISFKFQIRNGNCMAYPFDLATGNELSDNDVATNGFRLDLAKSKYLKTYVKYEAVNQKNGGRYSTDLRYNRPAKEGEEFTEPGIYTFWVENVNTDPEQPTSKSIYVGTDGVLFALANSGKTLGEINDLLDQGYEISEDGSFMNPECETYPCDIYNGVDLKDHSITDNGFSLNLAKSQYLNVSVQYSSLSINADGTGCLEAVKSGIAKEGQKYVDPGIYVIEATNPKTDPELHTSKTIYVGNSSFLKALATSGKSVDEINELIKEGYKIDEDGSFIEPVEEIEENQLNDEVDEASVQQNDDTENINEEELDEVSEKSSDDPENSNIEEQDETAGNIDNSDENISVEESTQEVGSSTNRTNPVLIIIVAALIVSLGVIGGYRAWIYKKTKEEASNILINDDVKAEIEPQVDILNEMEKQDDKHIKVDEASSDDSEEV